MLENTKKVFSNPTVKQRHRKNNKMFDTKKI